MLDVTVSTVFLDSATEMIGLAGFPLLGRSGPDEDIFIGVDHDVHMGRAIVTVEVNHSLNRQSQFETIANITDKLRRSGVVDERINCELDLLFVQKIRSALPAEGIAIKPIKEIVAERA